MILEVTRFLAKRRKRESSILHQGERLENLKVMRVEVEAAFDLGIDAFRRGHEVNRAEREHV